MFNTFYKSRYFVIIGFFFVLFCFFYLIKFGTRRIIINADPKNYDETVTLAYNLTVINCTIRILIIIGLSIFGLSKSKENRKLEYEVGFKITTILSILTFIAFAA